MNEWYMLAVDVHSRGKSRSSFLENLPRGTPRHGEAVKRPSALSLSLFCLHIPVPVLSSSPSGSFLMTSCSHTKLHTLCCAAAPLPQHKTRRVHIHKCQSRFVSTPELFSLHHLLLCLYCKVTREISLHQSVGTRSAHRMQIYTHRYRPSLHNWTFLLALFTWSWVYLVFCFGFSGCKDHIWCQTSGQVFVFPRFPTAAASPACVASAEWQISTQTWQQLQERLTSWVTKKRGFVFLSFLQRVVSVYPLLGE